MKANEENSARLVFKCKKQSNKTHAISRDRKINYWTQSSKLFSSPWLIDLISGA